MTTHRKTQMNMRFGEVDIDLFAGGGGASTGIEAATGVPVFAAVNHDAHAIEMHAANHPQTVHYREDVFQVSPTMAVRGRPVRLLWASPDCKHFSRAKGGRPRDRKIRSLADVVPTWARAVRPSVIFIENVPEFITWGPLDDNGHPVKGQIGETFAEFVGSLRALGYDVEWKTLTACDFGAPTSRKRLYMIARCDGQPIRWPQPTHGPGLRPYETAASCIDWALPVPSIFERPRPLAEATQRRIAEGIRRYVLAASSPFLVTLTHGARVEDIDQPMRTVTAANRGERALVVPTMVQTSYGERKGQAPRVLDLHKPLTTVVAGGQKHALVAAFLAKHYGGVVGQSLDRPLGTVTAQDHHSLVAAHVTKFYGTSVGSPVDAPLPTITGGGEHLGLVQALLTRFSAGDPTVKIGGESYVIVDIGMRMLQPRELARAQGFDDSYILTGTKTQQIARIGNSVCPPVARAIVAANLGTEVARAA